MSESPKVARQINSQKYRQPADNDSMVVNIAATNERNPLMVVKHKSAIERPSPVSALRSKLRLRPSTLEGFEWNSVFIKFNPFAITCGKAKNMPDRETVCNTLIRNDFAKELTIDRTTNLRMNLRELV
jgi:hypothetical protein